MKAEAVLTRTGSHHVTLEYGETPSKEECFFYFDTAWRGSPAMVTMSADRYKHSSGWSEWRIYAVDAREIDEAGNGRRGPDLTDLARRRLSDQLEPLVEAWLAGPDYAASRARAFASALERELWELRYRGTDRIRRTLSALSHELEPAALERLTSAVDAWDVFATIMNGEAS